jgi:hypothetical protein
VFFGLGAACGSWRLAGREEALESAVPGRVVGGVVLPAVPDDIEPGAGEDPHGVGVVFAAGDRVVVDLRGPGAGVAGSVGEVADGVAELFADGPAEGDGFVFAGLAGGGCGAGQADQRLGVGEAGAAVADLGEQAGGADGARAGQRGEDLAVGVGGELGGDLGFQRFDLGVQAGQHGGQGAGHLGAGSSLLTGRALRRRPQPLIQFGRVSAAAVSGAFQPGGQPFWR